MDRLYQMQVFAAVAETKGFASAARKLGLSPPAVTRAVAALENELGVTLLHRTTRMMRLNETGQRYLDDINRILADVAAADASAMGQNTEPRGSLTVTAPVLFGRLHVMPVITDYLIQYPHVQVNALFLDRVVGLVDEGIDVAVRIGHLPDSSDRALNVGDIRSLLVASPDYLLRYGAPKAPNQLSEHSLIASTAGAGSGSYWRFCTAVDAGNFQRQHSHAGLRVSITPRLTVTTNDAAIEAAESGLGITRINSYQVRKQLLEGKLKIVLHEHEPPPRPVHILHREVGHGVAKTRSFIDLLATQLRNDLAQLQRDTS